jgi:type I restriction enzyme M protein
VWSVDGDAVTKYDLSRTANTLAIAPDGALITGTHDGRVRLWRGTEPFLDRSSSEEVKAHFPGGKYRDLPGLCRRATRKEIEAQGWSLNPGRYVGVAPGEADDTDFRERLEELQEELEKLNGEAAALQQQIAHNVAELLA